MNRFNLTFHHLGLAVRRPKEAIAFLTGLGYATGEQVFDPEQNVNLVMCSHASMPAVEVIYPGTGTGPIDSLVARHEQGIVYHACYVSTDLAASLARLEAEGLRVVCLSPPKRAVLFGGRTVSFYSIAGMGLVEIIDGKGAPATTVA